MAHTAHLGITPKILQKMEPSPIVDGESRPKYAIAGSNQKLCQHLYQMLTEMKSMVVVRGHKSHMVVHNGSSAFSIVEGDEQKCRAYVYLKSGSSRVQLKTNEKIFGFIE